MPNHVKNKLLVTGENLSNFYEKLPKSDGFINSLIPMPEELHGTEAPNNDKEARAKFIKLYGAGDWYYWQQENWGVKWGDYNTDAEEYDDKIIITFDSAWLPPEKAIATISDMFPELVFYLSYQEPGMGVKGHFVYVSGQRVDHNKVNYNPDKEPLGHVGG